MITDPSLDATPLLARLDAAQRARVAGTGREVRLEPGRRLFDGDLNTSVALHLIEATTTTTGVILATYRPKAGTDPVG